MCAASAHKRAASCSVIDAPSLRMFHEAQRHTNGKYAYDCAAAHMGWLLPYITGRYLAYPTQVYRHRRVHYHWVNERRRPD
jgi:hypothetical protein